MNNQLSASWSDPDGTIHFGFVDCPTNYVFAPLPSGLSDAANVAITGGTIVGVHPLSIQCGGTGSAFVSGARTNLGLGSMALQDAGSVNINGGSVHNVDITCTSPIGINDGGTGASTKATARAALGCGTLSTQDSTAVNITGGTVKTSTVLSCTIKSPVMQNMPGGTGSGSALLGNNCPANNLTKPNTWLQMTAADGSAIWVPGWK